MNIGIECNKSDFLYDIHSLVKSFFPDDEVSIFTSDDTQKSEIQYDLRLKIDIPDYKDRKDAKDSLKRKIYKMLSDYTGKTLPWGTLSGIRPTKIPMKMLDEAESKKEGSSDTSEVRKDILSYVENTYLCSPQKADLAYRVAKREQDILRKIPTGPETYSLYVNIPFCPSICLYCTFASSPVKEWKDKIEKYLDCVIEEMRKSQADLVSKGFERGPRTVYFGGGTPTALTAAQLERLISSVEEIWDLSGCAEFTVEAGRPDSFTEEKLEVLKKHRVDRISVNPQTMNQKTLDLIGRHHTVEDTVRAFRMAKDAGFSNINMDMILGLPGEEREEVEHTLAEIRKLNPDSLTVHSLAIKRASRLRRTIREDREKNQNADYGNYEGMTFDNSEELMDLATGCAQELSMAPYYLYRQKNMRGNLENTGFARAGKECLYNILIMEEKQSIVAFGAGASSKRIYPGGKIDRVINPKNIATYEEKLDQLLVKKARLFS